MIKEIDVAIKYAKANDFINAISLLEDVDNQLSRISLHPDVKSDIRKRRKIDVIARLIKYALKNTMDIKKFVGGLLHARLLIKALKLE